MGLKNINQFEQHAEKIVLGVAAAGALFMGYLSMQTVTIPGASGMGVGPSEVEPAIKAEIDKMDAKRSALEATPLKPFRLDFVQEYQNKSSGKPLDDAIVALKIPVFSPSNVPLGQSNELPPPTVQAVIPAAALPELVHAEAIQVAVAPPQIDPATGQPMALQPGKEYVTQTKNVVVIDGWAPVGKMVLEMVKQQDAKKRFVPEVQRGMVYRVRVLRQELLPNGTWSKDEEIKPAKGCPAPTATLDANMPDGVLPDKMTEIEAQFQLIMLPTYYVDAQGVPVQPPIVARPIPKQIDDETTSLHNDIESARTPGGILRSTTTAPAVVTSASPTTLPSSADQIKTREVQPFTFWDDSVQADHTYRYRVQLQEVNPGFGWKWGLAKPELKAEPFIPVKDEGFVAVPGVIVVHSDIAFFIRGSNLGPSNGISGRIFKQESGRWYWSEFSVQNGMNIAAQINLGPNNFKEVDTKFALVDFQQSGNNLHVILKDPSGNLVTREVPEDWRRPENDALFNKAKEGAAAAAAVAATAPAPVMDMTSPTTQGRSGAATRGGTTPPTRGAIPVPVRP